jgi:hypothetical protein
MQPRASGLVPNKRVQPTSCVGSCMEYHGQRARPPLMPNTLGTHPHR